jgi:L-arabinose isomerase
VFNVSAGPAVAAAIIDLGDRFRLLWNEVDAVAPPEPLPRLPVARAVWMPRPNLKTAAAAWIYAGGPHHTVFSQALTSEHLEDFAEMLGIEAIRIDAKMQLTDLKNQLRWNEAYFKSC